MVEKVQESHMYQWLKKRDSKLLDELDKVIKYANDMLPLINRVFSNYTIHGIRHAINVMEYMYSLVGENIDKLSELEVTMLIESALLHDIGMVANEDEIQKIKNDDSDFGERKYSRVLEKFQNELIALQECVRPVHGKRSKIHIEEYKMVKLTK